MKKQRVTSQSGAVVRRIETPKEMAPTDGREIAFVRLRNPIDDTLRASTRVAVGQPPFTIEVEPGEVIEVPDYIADLLSKPYSASSNIGLMPHLERVS